MYTPPEVFLEHEGTRIYHHYKNGDLDERLNHWFNTDFNEDEDYAFDVRDLKGWEGGSVDKNNAAPADQKKVICIAIENGELVFPEEEDSEA